MENEKLSKRAILTAISIGVLYAAVYSIPYMKSIFYEGMMALTGATNAQLGLTMTIYGLGEVITPGLGGILAGRFDYKKVILYSMLIAGFATISLAFFPSFMMTMIVWVILVFSTLFMVWGCVFTAIRYLGTSRQQGRLQGFNAAGMGMGYLVINFLGILLYDNYVEIDPKQGMVNVFVGFGITIIICTILVYFLMKTTPAVGMEKDEDEDPNIFKQFKVIAKEKGVWYFGGLMFFLYSADISMQYFTPYFSEVLGVSVVFGGIIAIIRQYGLRMVVCPIGGAVADRWGSLAKVMIAVFLGITTTFAVIMLLPKQFQTVTIITAVMLILAFFVNLGMGTQYALVSEGRVPRKYTAAAVGMGTMIGFSPDIYQHALFGHWLDIWGSSAYTHIFIYGIVASVLGAVLMVNMLKWKKTSEYLGKIAD